MEHLMSYVSDGKCHNSNPGYLNQECGKPSTWVGHRTDRMFSMGFCTACKETGREAPFFDLWIRAEDAYNHPSYVRETGE